MGGTGVSFLERTGENVNSGGTSRAAVCDDHAEVLITVKNMLEEALFPA